MDLRDNASVTGFTQSSNFPTTPGAFQTAFQGGGRDAFVAKFISLPPPFKGGGNGGKRPPGP